MSILPHSADIAARTKAYLDECLRLGETQKARLATDPHFKKIYYNSLGADAYLGKLQSSKWKPEAKSSRSIIVRLPLLIVCGQLNVAYIELRRLIELTFWTVYFSEHPVEWENFSQTSSDGFHPNIEQPIQYNAHRSLKYYMDYAAERHKSEPSKIVLEVIAMLRTSISTLNAFVHPGHLVAPTAKPQPFEIADGAAVQAYEKAQKEVLSSCCILLGGTFTKRFNTLPAIYRAHFDRLAGTPMAKRIRAGAFGLGL